MLAIASAEAQNRFGELLDLSQREPVQITRRGRPVACVISMQDMASWQAYRRQNADDWFTRFTSELDNSRSPEIRAEIAALTDEDIYAMVREERNTLQSA